MYRGHVFSSLSTRIGKGADLFQAVRIKNHSLGMVDQTAAFLLVHLIFVFFYFSFLLFFMRDTANVCFGFTPRESARLIAVGPFENVFNMIAACTDVCKLFDGKRAVFVFI